jgi:hypothetical protein
MSRITQRIATGALASLIAAALLAPAPAEAFNNRNKRQGAGMMRLGGPTTTAPRNQANPGTFSSDAKIRDFFLALDRNGTGSGSGR